MKKLISMFTLLTVVACQDGNNGNSSPQKGETPRFEVAPNSNQLPTTTNTNVPDASIPLIPTPSNELTDDNSEVTDEQNCLIVSTDESEIIPEVESSDTPAVSDTPVIPTAPESPAVVETPIAPVTPDIPAVADSSNNNEEANHEEHSGEHETVQNTPAPQSPKKLVCVLSNQNEHANFALDIRTNDDGSKTVNLSDEDAQKATFDGYTFSPSGNEEAAVQYEDDNLVIQGGKVIKINAKVLFDQDALKGEIQVSYKVKPNKGRPFDTSFSKLATIDNCH